MTIGAVGEIQLAAARAEAGDVIHALRKGEDPKAKKPVELTLRTALDAYLAARKGLAPASATSYRLSMRYLDAWLDRPLRGITPETVEARHREIAQEIESAKRAQAAARLKAAKNKTGSKAQRDTTPFLFTGESTANSVMRTVRVLWNFAVGRDPTLPPNPTRRLEWFTDRRRKTHVKARELATWYKALCALESDVQRDCLKLILFTGLRRAEAASLTWSDVDFEAGLIRIPAQNTKARRELDLPMSDFVQQLLAARAKSRVPEINFVFPADSASGHISEPRFALDTIGQACGVHVGVHDLRRTFITVAESCDISPLALKALVNHALGSDVTEGYVMMTAEPLRAPAQRVADSMKSLCGIVDAAPPPRAAEA